MPNTMEKYAFYWQETRELDRWEAGIQKRSFKEQGTAYLSDL